MKFMPGESVIAQLNKDAQEASLAANVAANRKRQHEIVKRFKGSLGRIANATASQEASGQKGLVGCGWHRLSIVDGVEVSAHYESHASSRFIGREAARNAVEEKQSAGTTNPTSSPRNPWIDIVLRKGSARQEHRLIDIAPEGCTIYPAPNNDKAEPITILWESGVDAISESTTSALEQLRQDLLEPMRDHLEASAHELWGQRQILYGE